MNAALSRLMHDRRRRRMARQPLTTLTVSAGEPIVVIQHQRPTWRDLLDHAIALGCALGVIAMVVWDLSHRVLA